MPLSFPATRGQIWLLSGSNRPLLNHRIGQTLLFPSYSHFLQLPPPIANTKRPPGSGLVEADFQRQHFTTDQVPQPEIIHGLALRSTLQTPNRLPLNDRENQMTKGQQLATTGSSQRQRNGPQYQAARPTFGGP